MRDPHFWFYCTISSFSEDADVSSVDKGNQVEGEAQGDDELIAKLLKDIDKGPRHARVVKLEKSEIDLQDGESDFTIK